MGANQSAQEVDEVRQDLEAMDVEEVDNPAGSLRRTASRLADGASALKRTASGGGSAGSGLVRAGPYLSLHALRAGPYLSLGRGVSV